MTQSLDASAAGRTLAKVSECDRSRLAAAGWRFGIHGASPSFSKGNLRLWRTALAEWWYLGPANSENEWGDGGSIDEAIESSLRYLDEQAAAVRACLTIPTATKETP